MTEIAPSPEASAPPSQELSGLCTAILDALDEFDRRTLPLGLYACEEYRAGDKPFPRHYQEWMLCLAPCLKDQGFTPWLPTKPGSAGVQEGNFSFSLPDKRSGFFNLARTSKVKVRKFGSAYRIEPHVKFGDRWDELGLNRRIPALWKPSSQGAGRQYGLRIFVFIGFAREADPFAKELAELQTQLEWERYAVEYQTRTWPDREGRAFFVRLSVWASAFPDPQFIGATGEGAGQ